MEVVGKYLKILLIIFVGQLVTLFLAIKLSRGAGINLNGPVTIILGILIQVIAIFFITKDTIVARIIYSSIGLAISVLSLLILFSLLNQ